MMLIRQIPVKRLRLADEVARQLQEQICSGKYTTGQQLPPEPELMQQFGVGRSSIREAVRILANDGLVNVQQGLGTFVLSSEVTNEPLTKKIQRAHYDELNEVRLLLEAKIAEKAASHRTAKDISRMKSMLKKRKECALSNDAEGCIEADVAFHSAIADASKNVILVELYKTIAIHLKNAFSQRFKDTGAFLKTQQLHENLLTAIIEKNSTEAWTIAGKFGNQR